MDLGDSPAPSPLGSFGVAHNTGPFSALCIGASLGGPKAIERLLGELPSDFPLPVAICQHISDGFTGAWAERLSQCCPLPVKEAEHRERFEAGRVYVAPACGRHMRFRKLPDEVRIMLDADFADSLHVPSIDMMMSSAANTFGSKTLAVILTGMGSDGALGMLSIRRAGGYTIGEAESSAVSYSMPGSAYELGAIVEQLDMQLIPKRVVALGKKR